MGRIQTKRLPIGRPFTSISKKTAVILALCFTILLAIACANTGQQEITKEDAFNVGQNPKLVINNDNGSIDMIAGPSGVIVIQSTIKNPSKLDYLVDRQGNTITVSARQQPGFRNFSLVNAPAASVAITAPHSTTVDIRTRNGDLHLEGLNATGSLNTSDGRITLDNVKGDFTGGTNNGSIDLFHMQGSASLEAANGMVRVKQGRGSFDLENSNGGIIFEGELIPGSKNGFLTSNGSVSVKLEGEPNLRVLAKATNGTVESSLPLKATSTSEQNISGIIGNGDAELIIQAANGSVMLE